MRSAIMFSAIVCLFGCGVSDGSYTEATPTADQGTGGANASMDTSSPSSFALDDDFTLVAADTNPSTPEDAPKWQCRWSGFAGKQYKTCGGGSCAGRGAKIGEKCTGGYLYYCEGTTPKRVKCANACTRGKDGTDDACE